MPGPARPFRIHLPRPAGQRRSGKPGGLHRPQARCRGLHRLCPRHRLQNRQPPGCSPMLMQENLITFGLMVELDICLMTFLHFLVLSRFFLLLLDAAMHHAVDSAGAELADLPGGEEEGGASGVAAGDGDLPAAAHQDRPLPPGLHLCLFDKVFLAWEIQRARPACSGVFY